MDGILLINKPKGCTSFDVVKKVQKKLGTKKVGHTGTLDPETTGLLVICINRATKFIPYMTLESKKQYLAKMKLGIKTDTGDLSGTIIENKNFSVCDDEILESFKKFQKTYDQIPPKYSAKKINGKKAYSLARENKEFELKPSEVTIYKNEVLNIGEEIEFKTIVSKGTYVRSLIEDIACDLNTVGVMSDLSRIATDGFVLDDAIDIEDVEYDKVISLADYCRLKYDIVETKDLKAISNGVTQDIIEGCNYPLIYSYNNTLIALYEIKKGKAKVAFMFNASI